MTESAMQVEIENLSEVKRKVQIEVPSTEVARELDRAYKQLGKRAKVKGFRPGKVPRSVLEMYYRKEIEQEVSDVLVRRSLAEALQDKDLEPVNLSWPEAPPPVVAGQDYRFSVELEVSPEFTAADYLGLELAAPEVEVTDDEVDKRIDEIREHNAVLKPPEAERPIQEGDFVVLDYQGYFAGEAVAGANAAGAYFEVGSGKFNLDFERNLVGLAVGAESRFAVSLPEDFANPLIAGKVVEFQVKILEVKEKLVEELDDAFAQKLGGNFQTVADLRTAVREDIIKGKERERQSYLENQIADQLLAKHEFEVPPSMVQQEQENMLREQAQQYRQYGMDIANMDTGKMAEVLKPMAERRVRVKLVLGRIARQEGLAVDDAEVDAALARIAVHSGREVAEVKKFYEEHNLREILRQELLDDKTMKMVQDKAEISAAAPEGEAAAAAEAAKEEAEEKDE
jgi:trigger factor